MLFGVVLISAVTTAVLGHSGGHKSEACCPPDDDLLNSTRRFLLHELEDENEVERWGNEPSGKRQRERLCKCADPERENTIFDQVMTYMIVFIVVTFVMYVIWRSHVSRREVRRMKRQRELELASYKSKLQETIDNAKASLVSCDNDNSTCPICLEPLQNSSVHPAHCSHAFHDECIKQWLDTALIESEKGIDIKNIRALGCPTCCRPLYTIDLEDPQNDERADLEEQLTASSSSSESLSSSSSSSESSPSSQSSSSSSVQESNDIEV